MNEPPQFTLHSHSSNSHTFFFMVSLLKIIINSKNENYMRLVTHMPTYSYTTVAFW